MVEEAPRFEANAAVTAIACRVRHGDEAGAGAGYRTAAVVACHKPPASNHLRATTTG